MRILAQPLGMKPEDVMHRRSPRWGSPERPHLDHQIFSTLAPNRWERIWPRLTEGLQQDPPNKPTEAPRDVR